MTPDSWTHLKQFTAARIALGRAGASISTRDRLDFQLAHARARDAVLSPFNPEVLAAQFDGLQVASMVMTSCVPDRATYLRRPDLGRRLSDRSRADLELVRVRGPWDLSIVVSDGLSAFAAMEQSLAVLSWLLPRLLTANWRVAPLVVMANARVAVLRADTGEMVAPVSPTRATAVTRRPCDCAHQAALKPMAATTRPSP